MFNQTLLGNGHNEGNKFFDVIDRIVADLGAENIPVTIDWHKDEDPGRPRELGRLYTLWLPIWSLIGGQKRLHDSRCLWCSYTVFVIGVLHQFQSSDGPMTGWRFSETTEALEGAFVKDMERKASLLHPYYRKAFVR